MILRSIITSRCRVKLLEIFLSQPKEIFYVRQLVRKAGEEINAVRRELIKMEKAGLVEKESRGNRLYYWFKKDHLLYDGLLNLVSKTTGLGTEIIENKNKIGRIKLAMLSGRFARGLETKKEGVDLLLIGEISLVFLTRLIQTEEKKLGREINYTIMSREEFQFRKKRRDPFLLGILTDARIMLIGDEMDLVD